MGEQAERGGEQSGGHNGEHSRLRATGHPVRLRMLSLLTGTQLSAAEVARELGLTHANASYHLRVLERAGLLVVAGEEKVRGGVAKRYRHPWEVELNGPGGSPDDHEMYVRAAVEELVRRYRLRTGHGPATSTDAELWVAPEVWSRARDLLVEASHLLHGHAQPPRSEGAVHVNLTTFAFPMRDDPAGERPAIEQPAIEQPAGERPADRRPVGDDPEARR